MTLSTTHRVYATIVAQPGISPRELTAKIGLSRIAVYHHVQRLHRLGRIRIEGRTASVRYFPTSSSTVDLSTEVIPRALTLLSEDYEGIESISVNEVEDLLQEAYCAVGVNGEIQYGIRGFASAFQLRDEELSERLSLYLSHYFDEEKKRRKHGFFDATESLRSIMRSYGEKVYVDRVLFSEPFTSRGEFGRTRWAWELYFAKQNSDERLYESATRSTRSRVTAYLQKHSISALIFTPPTLSRPRQFPSFFQRSLMFLMKTFPAVIKCEKIRFPDRVLRAQKTLKGKDRIVNARGSFHLSLPDNLVGDSDAHIVIFDDNFSTGATVNAIAQTLRKEGFTGKITVITVTGSFHYDPHLSTLHEV